MPYRTIKVESVFLELRLKGIRLTDAQHAVLDRLQNQTRRVDDPCISVACVFRDAGGPLFFGWLSGTDEIRNIVNSAAVKALRDALENEVAAVALKILVEYQVADIAGALPKSTEDGRGSDRVAPSLLPSGLVTATIR
jgi:hypothetical protein